MYQWEKNGRIYVVKPKLPSDSPLGVQTGPLHESLAASALIDRLCYMSRLRCGGPNPLSGLGARGQAPPEKEPVADYILPHDTFINNLIRAAKQSGHSYWLVERQYAPTGLTFEYRANDLDSKKRYGYYVMPK
jgi:hypothetical protein